MSKKSDPKFELNEELKKALENTDKLSENAYSRGLKNGSNEEREKALDNTDTLIKNATSDDTPFTPGGYNPFSHNLIEMPPTPKLGTSAQKLNFDGDFDEDSHGGLFPIDPDDEIFKSQEKGGRKRRKSRKLGKSPKKSRKSKRKTTRKVRRHRRR